MTAVLGDADRHPSLDAAGHARLRALLEDPHAPRWNHTCGERLDGAGLAGLRRFAAEVRAGPPETGAGEEPAWVASFLARCAASVPAYRALAGAASLREVPTIGRGEIAAAPWSFVPDGESLDDLTLHATSGTGGMPVPVIQRPAVIAAYYPLVEAAIARHGADAGAAAGRRVGWVTVAWQADTYVLASASAYLGGTGTAKLNLHLAAWRSPGDRRPFLEACDPAVVTGDPVALAALADLDADLRPVALVSSATALAPALAARLGRRLACPVIDIYAAAEIGPVAASLPGCDAYGPLQPALHVEILDAAGNPCPAGVRGEITVTGGFNPLLPLVRYRTGDHAALAWHGRRPVLVDLEGRAPVRIRDASGGWVNSLDVTKALGRLALPRWSVHQRVDGGVLVRIPDSQAPERAAVVAAVAGVLGTGVEIEVAGFEGDGKVPPFTSELEGAAAV